MGKQKNKCNYTLSVAIIKDIKMDKYINKLAGWLRAFKGAKATPEGFVGVKGEMLKRVQLSDEFIIQWENQLTETYEAEPTSVKAKAKTNKAKTNKAKAKAKATPEGFVGVKGEVLEFVTQWENRLSETYEAEPEDEADK